MIHGGAGGDLAKMDPDKTLPIDTDIPRLKQGLVGGQFFAAYVPSSFIEKGGAKFALEEIDIIDRFTRRSPSLEAARTADDTEVIVAFFLPDMVASPVLADPLIHTPAEAFDACREAWIVPNVVVHAPSDLADVPAHR